MMLKKMTMRTSRMKGVRKITKKDIRNGIKMNAYQRGNVAHRLRDKGQMQVTGFTHINPSNKRSQKSKAVVCASCCQCGSRERESATHTQTR